MEKLELVTDLTGQGRTGLMKYHLNKRYELYGFKSRVSWFNANQDFILYNDDLTASIISKH